MNRKTVGLIFVFLGSGLASAFGATLDILWYTGGIVPTGGTYQSYVNNLVSQEENPLFNVSGSVNTWNVTLWSGGAMPGGTFNALVVGSREGGWSAYPDYTSLTSAVTSASFGDRVMLTGQDADWHYMNSPGSTNFDGPAGFLIDAINWAGSGTGLGAVFLDTGLEGTIFSGTGTNLGGSDTVNIPGAFSTYPINLGLSSSGLSNWGESAHQSFSGANTSLWTAINVNGSDVPITLVSAATASGGTKGSGVPDSSSTALLAGLGLAALVAARRLSVRKA